MAPRVDRPVRWLPRQPAIPRRHDLLRTTREERLESHCATHDIRVRRLAHHTQIRPIATTSLPLMSGSPQAPRDVCPYSASFAQNLSMSDLAIMPQSADTLFYSLRSAFIGSNREAR